MVPVAILVTLIAFGLLRLAPGDPVLTFAGDVRDPEILQHIRDVVLHAYLRDTDRAMVLDSTGKYQRPESVSGTFNAQQFLLQQYSENAD